MYTLYKLYILYNSIRSPHPQERSAQTLHHLILCKNPCNIGELVINFKEAS